MSKGKGRGGRRYLPYVFTEQGVAMLSSVLRSKRAVQVNVEIMRTFVRLRRMLASNEDLARKLAALEKKYDAQFRVVFECDPGAHGPTNAQETKDWVSREGTSSAVRKSVERSFPRFRNSENVEAPPRKHNQEHGFVDKTKPQDPFPQRMGPSGKRAPSVHAHPWRPSRSTIRSFCRDNSFQNCSLLDSNPSRVRLC